MEMWNCFLRIEQDIATTNNSVEGWHNCFTSIIKPQKKKYQDRAKRIKNVCTDYNDLFIQDYLRGIAYNFQLQN
ncbi:MULE domain-containing protein [Aphis craccivora]|uniref:MULE domain-containing protein n=1 Tax=Aphis craccivora TaxID=307492 RepID=A0A6G0YCU6_APHCR|nr:MULE domain-containing protein [Aphis craccivora]